MRISFRTLMHRLLTYPILLFVMLIYRFIDNKRVILDIFYLIRGFPHGYLKGDLRIAFFNGLKIIFPFKEDPSFDDVWLRNIYYPYNPSKEDVILDVGAHMGFFVLKIARKVKNVVAIEPHPINFYFLCLNIFQNCLQNKVIMLRLGLGREDGWAYLDESGYGFGRSKMTFLPQRYRVKIKSLDNLLSELPLSRVDLIKIDTEGDELKILEGAAKTLKRYKPKLLIAAYHFNDESIMIEKFLQKHDYKVFRYSVPLFLSRSAELYLYAEPKQK